MGEQRPVEHGTSRDALRAVALGIVTHTFAGRCPEEANAFASRDPGCAACVALLRVDDEVAWQQWGVVLDDAGSTDMYDTATDAAAAAAHGGDLVQVLAVHTDGDARVPGRASATQVLAAVRDRQVLTLVARAAFAAAHEVSVDDLDEGDHVWVADVENAISAVIADR